MLIASSLHKIDDELTSLNWLSSFDPTVEFTFQLTPIYIDLCFNLRLFDLLRISCLVQCTSSYLVIGMIIVFFTTPVNMFLKICWLLLFYCSDSILKRRMKPDEEDLEHMNMLLEFGSLISHFHIHICYLIFIDSEVAYMKQCKSANNRGFQA